MVLVVVDLHLIQVLVLQAQVVLVVLVVMEA
jgi:hypothetical protein